MQTTIAAKREARTTLSSTLAARLRWRDVCARNTSSIQALPRIVHELSRPCDQPGSRCRSPSAASSRAAGRADCDHVAVRTSIGIAATWILPAAAPLVPALADMLRIQRRLDGRCVALTFDDGPHPDGTPRALEFLADAGVRATFFLVGEQVERQRTIAGEIAAAGHEIGLHGYRHRLLLRRTVSSLSDDLDRAMHVIGEATGRVPAWYRPPLGIFSSGGLELVRTRGWRPVLWSKWGRDWTRRATGESITRLATRGLAAGDIVLLHDADHYGASGSWRNTIDAIPRIVAAAHGAGLEFATLSGSR